MSSTWGAILIILFWLLFLSISFGANDNKRIINCRDAIFQLEASPPYVVATLFDGTMQVFDTSGKLVYDIDLELAVPNRDYLKSLPSPEEKIVIIEGNYDFAVLFPTSSCFVVFRDKYTYHEDYYWQMLRNSFMHFIGKGSSIEVWDSDSGERIFEHSVFGASGPPLIDVYGDRLALTTWASSTCIFYLFDLNTRKLEKKSSLPITSEIRLSGDSLFTVYDNEFCIYRIDDNNNIQRETKLDTPCPSYSFFTMRVAGDKRPVSTIYNSCLDTTFGPVRFLGDSALFEECKRIINYTITQEYPFKRPVGGYPISGELILESFSDTLYLVDFQQKTIRTRLVSEIVDTAKYFLPSPIVSNYFYSKMKDTGHKDSTFAILKIDL